MWQKRKKRLEPEGLAKEKDYHYKFPWSTPICNFDAVPDLPCSSTDGIRSVESAPCPSLGRVPSYQVGKASLYRYLPNWGTGIIVEEEEEEDICACALTVD